MPRRKTFKSVAHRPYKKSLYSAVRTAEAHSTHTSQNPAKITQRKSMSPFTKWLLIIVLVAVGYAFISNWPTQRGTQAMQVAPTSVAATWAPPQVTAFLTDTPAFVETSTMAVFASATDIPVNFDTVAPSTNGLPPGGAANSGGSGSGGGAGSASSSGSAGNSATALCNDGSYYYGASHRGACSGHKGVQTFYK